MLITRRYTVEGQDPFAAFNFRCRALRAYVNPDGSVVFEMKDLLAPEEWTRWPWTSSPKILPPGRGARAEGAGSEEGSPDVAAMQRPVRRATPRPAARRTPGKCSGGWPAAGRTGAGKAATLRRGGTLCSTM